MIFETERLIVRLLHLDDRDAFYGMMSNPNIMNPIPRQAMDRETSDACFYKYLNLDSTSKTRVLAVEEKETLSFIGIVAYLKNNEEEDEIGYRLLEQYWGKGYGTEITKGLINFGFYNLELDLITADVNTTNERSIKILDKFFSRYSEFYNKEDNCTDRRYKLARKDWL
ncbi:MAG: GNAT family N-acetyltransferase [Flavobacteriaceae bacterium]|nr:GNAT family N-acetyltransferase [Flavobacteriaceae bacterium]